jgi:hypothetical protein
VFPAAEKQFGEKPSRGWRIAQHRTMVAMRDAPPSAASTADFRGLNAFFADQRL